MTRERKPTFGHRLEYAVLRTVIFLAGLLPIRVALAMGAFMGRIAWSILGIRRKVSLINLHQAFPQLTAGEICGTGLRSYMNSGRFMMEFARQNRMDRKYVERHITINDPARLEQLKALDGALLITGHFGNWELFGIACRYFLDDVSFLVGRQSNGLVDDYINRMRSSHGIELYNRRSAVKGVLSSVRRGGYVCWLSDQDAGESGVVVDFFGHPASTPRGAAAFSVKLGVPVVPAVLVRDGTGPDHRLVIGEPVFPDGSLCRDEAETRVTAEYTQQLEEIIRQRPDLYWWAHRRWKSTGLYSGQNKHTD